MSSTSFHVGVAVALDDFVYALAGARAQRLCWAANRLAAGLPAALAELGRVWSPTHAVLADTVSSEALAPLHGDAAPSEELPPFDPWGVQPVVLRPEFPAEADIGSEHCGAVWPGSAELRHSLECSGLPGAFLNAGPMWLIVRDTSDVLSAQERDAAARWCRASDVASWASYAAVTAATDLTLVEIGCAVQQACRTPLAIAGAEILSALKPVVPARTPGVVHEWHGRLRVGDAWPELTVEASELPDGFVPGEEPLAFRIG